jgi:hypothetical protein
MILGDFRVTGLEHSYQIEPPGYSQPQKTYYYYYDGFMTRRPGPIFYEWEVGPPFFIISGQGTSGITLELIPTLYKTREKEISGITRYNFAELNLKIGKWKETRNLYYKNGPLWKIVGNRNPKITYFNDKPLEKRETYSIIPLYDQSGIPPKYNTEPSSYTFHIKNGKVMKFYGNIPPLGVPMVDIFWYKEGPTYLTFYSHWDDDTTKFPNTLDIYVS